MSQTDSDSILAGAGGSDFGNSRAAANFKYVKQLFGGFHKKIYFIPDWAQNSPNAWYFREFGQDYVVFTGGLLRLPTISIPGLSVITSNLVAQSQGFKTIGEADYWGVAMFLREVWFGDNFLTMFERGLGEIKATMAYSTELLTRDTWQCRFASLENGASFKGVPDCAKTV